MEEKKTNLRDERQREQGEGVTGNADLSLGLEENILFILFFFQVLAWLSRVGLVRFNRFQTLKTETELN